MKRRLRPLSPRGVRILKMFHLFFAFCWIIGAIALCLLLFITSPQSGDELYMRSRVVQIIDPVFLHNLHSSQLWGTVQTSLLLLYIYISVRKPWAKKKEKAHVS